MKRWRRGGSEKIWHRLTAEDAKSSNQGKPGGRGGGAAAPIQQLLHVDERRNKVTDRVVRCQFD